METADLDLKIETLDITSRYDVKWVSAFLKPQGLEYDTTKIDGTVVLVDGGGQIVATGSYQNNVLKYVSVLPLYRSTSAFSDVVTHLFDFLMQKYKTVFVYTLPENIVKFAGLGFSLISKAEPLYAVLELGPKTIIDYKKEILSHKRQTSTNNIAGLVMNCNPFTNGHKYLIETAAAENEVVYLFVVEEDRSIFPFDVRWELIKKGIAHLKNVVMLRGASYIISGATFPDYFLKLKNPDTITKKQTELDINIFCEHIAPVLGITRRYVGEENHCPTTAFYNITMKEVLPKYNIQLKEIKRKMSDNPSNDEDVISASNVRESIKRNKMQSLSRYLPQTTIDFLNSDQAVDILNKIKGI